MDQTPRHIRFRPQAYLADTGLSQPAFWNVLITILDTFGVKLHKFAFGATEAGRLTSKLYLLLPPILPGGVHLNMWGATDELVTFAQEARTLLPAQQRFLLFSPVMQDTYDAFERGLKLTSTLEEVIAACGDNPELLSSAQLRAIITTDLQRLGKKLRHDLAALIRVDGDDELLRRRAVAFIVSVRGLQCSELRQRSWRDLHDLVDAILNK